MCAHIYAFGIRQLVAMAKAGRVPSLQLIVVMPLQAWDKPVAAPVSEQHGALSVMTFADFERQVCFNSFSRRVSFALFLMYCFLMFSMDAACTPA